MSRSSLWFSLAGLAALLLAACAPQPGAPATTAPVASQQFTQVVETAPPSLLPPSPAQAKPTALPSDTPHATDTPAGPTPTPDLFTYDRHASQSISPGGRYAARVLVALPLSPDGTALGEAYHVQVSALDFQDNSQQNVIDEWRNYGLGLTTPSVLGWSADSRAFYVVESGVPDGCGPPFFENLRRVDTDNGQSTQVAGDLGRAPALSPDGSRLASLGEGQVLVYDFEIGEKTSIPFEAPAEEYWGGGTTWSPDGERLLFSATLNPCGASDQLSSSLYLTDLSSSSARNLLEADPRLLAPLSWPLDDLAQLGDASGQDYWLQVSSGQVSQEPPAEVAAARQALFDFFSALKTGDYAAADGLYGGSYELLEANNPDVDPNDRAALLENACLINGFQCLAVYRAVLVDKPAQGEYRFRVVFEQDGGAFVLGPCCGADIAEQPPQSEFVYTVKRDEAGKYRVIELPVYVP
ncbi:MAG TPA: hypothetical protein VI776_10610 [Anaerolineales bacterium]|nr:hypothetical protein [Anaerolineales bacterium]